MQDGDYLITAKRAGTTDIRIMLKGEDDAQYFGTIHVTVRKNQNSLEGAYLAKNGVLVIDTADAEEQSEYALSVAGSDSKADKGQPHEWQLNGNGLKCLPDNGNGDNSNWAGGSAGSQANAPKLSYTFDVPQTEIGKYSLYVNHTSGTMVGDGDSYWIQLDSGSLQMGSGDGTNIWFDFGAVDLSAGTHTITVYAREDGIAVNQIVLHKNAKAPETGIFLIPSERAIRRPEICLETDCRNITMELISEPMVFQVSASIKYSENPGNAEIAVASSNKAIATAEYVENRVKITPVSAGTVNITVSASAEGLSTVSKEFSVTVLSEQEKGTKAYRIENGKVVINAQEALADNGCAKAGSISGFNWETAANGVQLMPNNGKNWTDTAALNQVPYVEYTIYVEEAGNYYFSAYSNHPDDASDSFHVGIDGTYKFSGRSGTLVNPSGSGDATVGDQWFYYHNNDTSVQLNEGLHTLRIWAREDGLYFKQFMLSLEKQSSLSGMQKATAPSLCAVSNQ